MTQSFDEWFYPTASPKAAWDAGQQSKQAEIDGLKAQLIRAGWVDNGGVLLRPPLGETPRFDLLDAKQAEIDELNTTLYEIEMVLNDSCYSAENMVDIIKDMLKGTTNEQ